MKKLLFTLSALSAISCGAFGATHNANVSVEDNGTPETAFVLDEVAKGDYYVARRKGADWSDYYFYISTPSITSSSSGGSAFVYSTSASGGYSEGYRSNYHFMLDANNSSFSTTSGAMFSYSGNGRGYGATTSVGYFLESRDGTAVEFKVVAPSDNSKLAYWDVNLETYDGNGAMDEALATAKGERGRAFSIGSNVTAKALDVTIKGKLITDLTEGYIDSLFTIKSGGKLEVTENLNVTGSNLLIENGGVAEAKKLVIKDSNVKIEQGGSFTTVNSNQASTITGDSKVDVNGSLVFESGIQLYGGTTTVGSTGNISVAGFRLSSGKIHVDGTLQGLNGKTFALVSEGGSFGVGANADISKISALNMEKGTTNIDTDVYIKVLRTVENKTASMNVAEGKTFSAYQSNFQANTNTTINGNLTITDGATITSGATFTIASGTTTFGKTESVGDASVVSNYGILNVNKGATLRIKSVPSKDMGLDNTSRANIGGIVNVDGGKVYLDVNEASKNALAGLISGTTTLKNGASIEFSKTLDRIRLGIAQGGTLSVSADSKIIGDSIVFTRTNSTKDYTQGGKLILQGGDNFKGDILVLRMAGTSLDLAQNQSYEFNKLYFHHYAGFIEGEANDITIDLNGATSLNIKQINAFSGTALGSLMFKDFQEGVVKIDNITAEILAEINTNGSATIGSLNLSMSAVDANGLVIDGDWSLNNGFLSHSAFAVAVPEPAEWAMLLGALALGLAVYRRRK